MKLKIIVLTMTATAMSTVALAQQAPQLRADNIDEVLKSMTLEEKAQLLVGGGNDSFTGSGAMLGHQEKLVAGAAGTTVSIPRLGIPETCVADGPDAKEHPRDVLCHGLPRRYLSGFNLEHRAGAPGGRSHGQRDAGVWR